MRMGLVNLLRLIYNKVGGSGCRADWPERFGANVLSWVVSVSFDMLNWSHVRCFSFLVCCLYTIKSAI